MSVQLQKQWEQNNGDTHGKVKIIPQDYLGVIDATKTVDKTGPIN